MSFGRRDPETWSVVNEEVDLLENQIVETEDTSVRSALEKMRRDKLLTKALTEDQQKLWHRLFTAYKFGESDLMRINFQLSEMEMEDLLDICFVASQMSSYGGSEEMLEFYDSLFEFLQTFTGPNLDQVLVDYFQGYPSAPEPELIQLVDGAPLLKYRLDQLLEMKYDCLTQSVITEGVTRLLDLEEEDSSSSNYVRYISEAEANRYIRRLMMNESILDQEMIRLIDKAPRSELMAKLMRKIAKLVKLKIHRGYYKPGFDSVGSAVVRRLPLEALAPTANIEDDLLIYERLLALKQMHTLNGISDETLVTLLMEREVGLKESAESAKERKKIVKEIKARKNHSQRLIDLGLIRMFEAQSYI